MGGACQDKTLDFILFCFDHVDLICEKNSDSTLMSLENGWTALFPDSQSVTTRSPSSPATRRPKHISAFHQLHCLSILRDTIGAYRHNKDPKRDAHGHTEHCLDYIRQALMCCADSTIEWPVLKQHDGHVHGDVNGYGVTHQCRDWDGLSAFAVQSRATNKTGLLDS